MPHAPRPPARVRAVVAVLAMAVASLAGCADPPPRAIVLVTLDTVRWDHLGIYGDPLARTPHLDRIGRRGVVFENAFVDVPSTLPSHATVMTGAVSLRHGVRLNGEFSLPPDARTLAESLRERGYATGAVIASVSLRARHGLDQGFGIWDEAFRAPFRGLDPALAVRSRRHASTQRRADEVTDVALGVLERLPDPFFLWVHYVDPHLTYDPPFPFDRVPGLTAYAGEIAFTDRELGRVLGALEPGARRPVVAVIADHGEGLGEHRQDGHGMFLYDTTTRVPFLIAGPGGTPRVVRSLARNADVAATLEAAAGLAATLWPDGRDLLAAGASTTEVLHETLTPTRRYHGASIKALRTATAKYVRAPRPELYDLERDPGERDNLLDGDAALGRELRERLEDEVTRLAHRPADAGAEVEEEQLEALRSLGYLATRGEALPEEELALDGIDPKDLIDPVLAHRYVFDERFTEARVRLDRFLARHPQLPGPGWEPIYSRVLFSLAVVEASEGRDERVRELLREAVRLDPDCEEAVAALARLDARQDPRPPALVLEAADTE